MEQQTNEWLEWRRKGIGSSDAPIIMGESEYKTIYQLWEEKIGISVEVPKSDFILQRGHELEPIARARYELESDIEMKPALCQHAEYPWMRASMDGWNEQASRGLEIKYIGVKDLELARSGTVPPRYYAQIMHQFIVTGCSQIDFYGYCVPKGVENHKGTGVKIEVFPDRNYITRLLNAEMWFWELVLLKTPPKFCDDDFKSIRKKGATALATQFEEWSAEHGVDSPLLEIIKSEILAMCGPVGRFKLKNIRINNGVFTIMENGNGTDGKRSS